MIPERYSSIWVNFYFLIRGCVLLPVFFSHKHQTETQKEVKGKLTWYSARGAFISKMIDNNIHPIIVAQMAGNSPNTIYKHYFKNTTEDVIYKQREKTYGY